MQRKYNTTLGLAVLLGLFFAINLFAGTVFRSVRLDLTEGGLYTLSDGTKNILRNLDEPIHLRFYFSQRLANDLPDIKSYGDRVRELLEEYAAHSNGKVELEVIDPDPFSEEEDRAVAFGLQGAPANATGDPLYFGLAGTNSTDQEEVIPFFQVRREEFLEYDITKLIHNLSNPEKTVVGVLSSLPIMGAAPNPMNPRASAQPWFIIDNLRQLFEVKEIPASATELPEDLGVLVVIHPKGLDDQLLYSIDQFVLGGGHMVAFVDPHCEADEPPTDPRNPMASMGADRSSDFGPLLKAWGVEMSKDAIVVDRLNAQRVGYQGKPVDYVAWLGLRQDACSQDDPITSELAHLNFATAGKLAALEDATTTFTPVIHTSAEATTVPTREISFMPDPNRLLREYQPGSEPLTLAARVSGTAQSAYPTVPEGVEAENHIDSGEIQILLVADADMLADRWWVDVQNFFGRRIAVPNANNADLLVNAVDNLSGSNDLISLRSRSTYNRPFDKVIELRRSAEARFRAEEQSLESKLQETERRISELQQQKNDPTSKVILTPEQRNEINRFRQEQVETRKRLRDVRHQLAKEIERLGMWLKLINIALIPLCLIIFAGLRATATHERRK